MNNSIGGKDSGNVAFRCVLEGRPSKKMSEKKTEEGRGKRPQSGHLERRKWELAGRGEFKAGTLRGLPGLRE